MRLAISLLILVCCAAKSHGQEDVARQSQDDNAVRDLLEKIHELQPPEWSYADLTANSDLIVIAKAQSRVEVEWNDDIGGSFGKGTTTLLSNRLRVLSVLKGKSADEINVMTLRWNPNVVVLTNHDFAVFRTELFLPNLVRVVIDGQITGYGGSQPIETYKIEPEYLLYLRRLEGGGYVPVTGQRYSGMSVRTLNN